MKLKPFSSWHVLAASCVLLVVAQWTAPAAPVTFQSPAAITSTATLDAIPLAYSGATFVQAVGFGLPSAQSVTTSGGHTINFVVGAASGSAPSGTGTELFNTGTQSSTPLYSGDTGSATFNKVLQSDGWASSGSSARPQTLRLGGLTIGTTYAVELLASDMRPGSTARTEKYSDSVSGGNTSASFSTASAQSVIGTFTADATIQDIYVIPTTAGTTALDTTVSAFTLYTLPTIPIVVGAVSISPSNTAYAGESRVFSVTTSGPATGYRWEWDNGSGGASFSLISGAGSLTYTQNTTGLSGGYQYQFVATNSSTSVTSSIVTLTVNAATVPLVIADTAPNPVTRYTGGSVTFTATFDGNHPITNQWQVDKGSGYVNLAGATNTSLTLTNLQLSDAGNYRLAATNTIGDSASSAATLTVNDISLAKYHWQAPVPFNGLGADKILTNPPGAFFGAAAFGNTAYQVTLGNGHILSFTTDGSVATATGVGTSTGAYPAGTGLTTSNANFDAVLNRFSYDGGPKTITLNNLTAGEQYSVQFFALDNRSLGGGESNRLANFQDPADDGDISTTFKMGDNVYVVGTFTAANTTESIQMNLPTGNAGSINAVVVRALSYTPPTQPPTVLTDPKSQTIFAGRAAGFTVTANSYILPGYQWQAGPAGGPFTNLNNGGIITGATSNVLFLTNATAFDGAQFQAVVSNPAGSVTSGAATLTIVPVPSASGPAGLAVKTLSPVAYWSLNETNDPSSGTAGVYDAAGTFDGLYLAAAQNAFNGIVGVQPLDGFPLFATNQGALLTTFNLDQSWVTTPPLNLNTNTVTIGMWIYPEGDQTGPAGLYVNRNSGTVGGIGYYSTNQLGYKWNNDGSTTWGFVSGLVIPTNIWSYVAVVIAPTNATLYLYNTNGLLSATNFTTHTNLTWGGSQANIRIGCDNSPARTFNGKIDEVAVFNRSLTSAEIMQLTGGAVKLNAALSGNQLQITWPFGTLLEAPDITGPWTTNAHTSPYVVAPTGARKFYRIQIQ